MSKEMHVRTGQEYDCDHCQKPAGAIIEYESAPDEWEWFVLCLSCARELRDKLTRWLGNQT